VSVSFKGNQAIPIQANVLLTTSLSMRDIKAEMLLSFVGTLFDDYYRLYAPQTEYDTILETYDEITSKVISEMSEYIATKVIQFKDVRQVLNQANTNNRTMIVAKGIEPMAVYLDFIVKAYMKHFKDGDQFIPDFLAISIIHFFRNENDKCFIHHPFIQEYDFSPYFDAVDEKNIKLKKKNLQDGQTRIWQERTILDKMSKIAESMVNDYLEKQYKVLTTRVSKKRGKKRK